jgi:hypothetical protein
VEKSRKIIRLGKGKIILTQRSRMTFSRRDSSGSGYGKLGGCKKPGNEILGSLKYGEILG